MVIDDVEMAQATLRELFDTRPQTVAFTGAGISTESGVPDFRSKDSAWKRHPPLPYAEWLASAEARALAWRRKFAMDDIYAGAQPNRGHRALARLMADGIVSAIVTQNIDGLHVAAGAAPDNVIELHGNGTYALCVSCEARHEIADVRRAFEIDGLAPECACGGPVKSATISFGQAMPAEPMRRARAQTLACELFLAIGSSLVVYPAAAFPLAAKENGAKLVIVNREPTPLDDAADVVLRGDIGDIFEPFQ